MLDFFRKVWYNKTYSKNTGKGVVFMKTFRVLSQNYALRLLDMGYHLVGTEPNNKYPQYVVYLFEYKPEMLLLIKHFKNEDKQQKQEAQQNVCKPKETNSKKYREGSTI